MQPRFHLSESAPSFCFPSCLCPELCPVSPRSTGWDHTVYTAFRLCVCTYVCERGNWALSASLLWFGSYKKEAAASFLMKEKLISISFSPMRPHGSCLPFALLLCMCVCIFLTGKRDTIRPLPLVQFHFTLNTLNITTSDPLVPLISHTLAHVHSMRALISYNPMPNSNIFSACFIGV